MKNKTILINWLLTVLFGSFILALVLIIFTNSLDGFIGLFIINIFFSGLFSIPAVIIFVAYNNHTTKIQNSNLEYYKEMQLMHLIVGLIYLGIGLIIGFAKSIDLWMFLVLIVCYLPIGMIIWEFSFAKINRSLDSESSKKTPQ